ncbi:MAG: hypothetical protein WD029_06990 [Microthrixaceae bacterium]
MTRHQSSRARRVKRSTVLIGLGGLLVAALVVTACTQPPPAPVSVTNPLTLGQGNLFGNGSVTSASISGNGDVVAFVSAASNLVAGDTNNVSDLFVRVISTGTVTRPATGVTGDPRVSLNGRYVSFKTSSGQLAVLDRSVGTISSWTATPGYIPITPVVANDGSVAITGTYSSLGLFQTACRVFNLVTSVEQDCPHGGPGYGKVTFEAASANGRYVLYSWLDQNDGGTSARLLWDRTTDTTSVIPATVTFFPANAVVSDRGTIAFWAPDFSGQTQQTMAVYVPSGDLTTVMPIAAPSNYPFRPTGISADGNLVTFLSEFGGFVVGDTNGVADLFQWKVSTGAVMRTSLAIGTGEQLSVGVRLCGYPPSQVRSNGTGGCALTPEAVAVADSNGFIDGYKFG